MKQQPLYTAFVHAWNGLKLFFRNDRNGKIHLLAAVATVIAGMVLGLSATEWCIVLLCNAIVISFEMINHALEHLCNTVHADLHPLIKTTKDVAAAAVLCSAIISAVIGLVIFLPKIGAWL